MRLSYTRFSSYESCPYSVVLSDSDYARPNVAHMMTGRVVHKLAEAWPGDPGWMSSRAKQYFEAEERSARSGGDKLYWGSAEKRDNALRKAELLCKVTEKYLGPMLEGSRREWWIECPLGDDEVRGIIDIWVPNKIVDIKTSSDDKWLKWDQLDFYAWILIENGVEVEKTCFLAPALDPVVRCREVDMDVVRSIHQRALVVLDRMKQGDWSPRPSPERCSSCFHGQYCTFRGR